MCFTCGNIHYLSNRLCFVTLISAPIENQEPQTSQFLTDVDRFVKNAKINPLLVVAGIFQLACCLTFVIPRSRLFADWLPNQPHWTVVNLDLRCLLLPDYKKRTTHGITCLYKGGGAGAPSRGSWYPCPVWRYSLVLSRVPPQQNLDRTWLCPG